MASSAVSRVVALGALTASGQLVIVGTLPLYSRVFDPATYGVYVIFVGAFTIVSVLAGLRYDSAIVLPHRESLAVSLAALVMAIAVTVSGLLAAVTLALSHLQLANDERAGALSQFGYGLAAATLLGAVQRCLGSWYVRGGRYLQLGLGQLLFCVVTVVAQLSMVRILGQLPALVWGYVCALGAQALYLVAAGRLPRRAAIPAHVLRGMVVAARKYRRFPVYMVGYALASTARDRLIQLALGLGAGAAAVGRFGLAYRVTFAPNSLIYSAVSPVFYGIASRGNRLNVGRIAAALVETAFVLLLVPYLCFAIEAPTLTDAVLSDKWHGTGPYVRALAGPALLLAATCWLDRAFDSFRRQPVALLLEATFTVFAVLLVGVGAQMVPPVLVTWLFAAAASAYYWIYFLSVFLACGFEMAQFRRACATGLLLGVMALLLSLIAHQVPALPWRVAAYAAVMGAVVLAWMALRGGVGTLRTVVQSRVHAVTGAPVAKA